MRIAVIGHEGRLGSELVRKGCIPVDTDIRNRYEVFNAVHTIEPDVVINCAAITDVNYCESMEGLEKAIQINYKGVVNLRESFDGLLVQMSTDYVFDGKHGPYDEKAKHSLAVNMYGMTKQAAEAALQIYTDKPYCIIRTTCLFGSHNQDDLASKVVMALKHGEEFKASLKPPGNPTYIPYLADGILELLKLKQIPNVIHIAGKDVITRYEFALMIANVFGYDAKLIIADRTGNVLGLAKRPSKAGLKVKLAEKFGLPIYTAIEGLEAFRDAIL